MHLLSDHSLALHTRATAAGSHSQLRPHGQHQLPPVCGCPWAARPHSSLSAHLHTHLLCLREREWPGQVLLGEFLAHPLVLQARQSQAPSVCTRSQSRLSSTSRPVPLPMRAASRDLKRLKSCRTMAESRRQVVSSKVPWRCCHHSSPKPKPALKSARDLNGDLMDLCVSEAQRNNETVHPLFRASPVHLKHFLEEAASDTPSSRAELGKGQVASLVLPGLP